VEEVFSEVSVFRSSHRLGLWAKMNVLDWGDTVVTGIL
jgi:hypothetical protein